MTTPSGPGPDVLWSLTFDLLLMIAGLLIAALAALVRRKRARR